MQRLGDQRHLVYDDFAVRTAKDFLAGPAPFARDPRLDANSQNNSIDLFLVRHLQDAFRCAPMPHDAHLRVIAMSPRNHVAQLQRLLRGFLTLGHRSRQWKRVWHDDDMDKHEFGLSPVSKSAGELDCAF